MAILCSQMKSQPGRAPTGSDHRTHEIANKICACFASLRQNNLFFLENLSLHQLIVIPNVKFKLVICIDGLAVVTLDHSCGKRAQPEP